MQNVNIIRQQLIAIIQQAEAALSALPCEHLEVEQIEGATMGNIKYRCKVCGEVVDGDG